MPKSHALTDCSQTPEEARKAGFYPITEDYWFNETWMLQNAADQLARGSIQHCIVSTSRGIGRQLWRR